MKSASAALIVIGAVLLFYFVLNSAFSGFEKFIFAIAILLGTSISLKRLLNTEGEYGLIFLRSKAGLELVDGLARRAPALWRAFSEVGMVLAFGICSILISKNMDRKIYVLSLILLVLSTLFIIPYILPIALSIISFPFNPYKYAPSSEGAAFPPLYLGVFLIILFGGIATVSIAGLLMNSLVILASMVRSLLGEAGALAEAAPGATFVLPGINLPFFEGIAALVVLLAVHEAAHGILARVEKIRLQSSGLVFLGFLPIGAFVDPDEKQLQKLPAEKQDSVLVAGSTANFLAAGFFFFALLAFVLLSASLIDSKVEVGRVYAEPALGVLKEGMVIEKINGISIASTDELFNITSSIKENATVVFTTDKGEFTLKAGSNGQLGIIVKQPYKHGWGWLSYLYNFIGLAFVLNFLIGSVNMLPVPAFDGYRIIYLSVKNKKIANALAGIVLALFALNFIPGLWH